MDDTLIIEPGFNGPRLSGNGGYVGGVLAGSLGNALLAGRLLREALDETPAFATLPTQARLCAVLSLSIWFAVAACGRLIAYF